MIGLNENTTPRWSNGGHPQLAANAAENLISSGDRMSQDAIAIDRATLSDLERLLSTL